jgi:ribosomal protein S1
MTGDGMGKMYDDPDLWEKFIKDHKIGDACSGIVIGRKIFGLFVELEEGVLAFCALPHFYPSRKRKGIELALPVEGTKIRGKILGFSPNDYQVRIQVGE